MTISKALARADDVLLEALTDEDGCCDERCTKLDRYTTLKIRDAIAAALMRTKASRRFALSDITESAARMVRREILRQP